MPIFKIYKHQQLNRNQTTLPSSFETKSKKKTAAKLPKESPDFLSSLDSQSSPSHFSWVRFSKSFLKALMEACVAVSAFSASADFFFSSIQAEQGTGGLFGLTNGRLLGVAWLGNEHKASF